MYTKDISAKCAACKRTPYACTCTSTKASVKDEARKTLIASFSGHNYIAERTEAGDLQIFLIGDDALPNVFVDTGSVTDASSAGRAAMAAGRPMTTAQSLAVVRDHANKMKEYELRVKDAGKRLGR